MRHLQNGIFSFAIYVKNKNILHTHACVQNATKIFIGQFQKIIIKIFFTEKLKEKYVCSNALCLNHAYIFHFF